MARKTTMVQPKPANPDLLELLKLLELMGNNRAYTVINHDYKKWVVHFEGDTDHTIITIKG